MSERITVEAAAQALRDALRDTVKRFAGWYLFQGLLMVAGGVLALVYPLISSTAFVVVLGWLLILNGVLQGIGLIGARGVPYFWLQLIAAVLSVVVGVMILRDPAQALVTLTLLMIIFFIIAGIARVVFALMIRPFPSWLWLLLSGVIGILLGIYLWSLLPEPAAWLLGLLLGVHLISDGAGIAILAWQVRKL